MAHRDKSRIAELRAAISERIRTVCNSMPQVEFDALVTRMAEVEHKYEAYTRNETLGSDWGTSYPVDEEEARGA